MHVLNFLLYVDAFKRRHDFVEGVMTTEGC